METNIFGRETRIKDLRLTAHWFVQLLHREPKTFGGKSSSYRNSTLIVTSIPSYGIGGRLYSLQVVLISRVAFNRDVNCVIQLSRIHYLSVRVICRIDALLM